MTTGATGPSGESERLVRPLHIASRILRIAPLVAVVLALGGCREVRVQVLAHGTTTAIGSGNEIVVVRSDAELAHLGIKAPVNFRSEFGVALLMGPHRRSGYLQVIESLVASEQVFRAVAFEEAPPDGGQSSVEYRTYTLWIVPNSAYVRGFHLEAVTPSNERIATGVLP